MVEKGLASRWALLPWTGRVLLHAQLSKDTDHRITALQETVPLCRAVEMKLMNLGTSMSPRIKTAAITIAKQRPTSFIIWRKIVLK